MEDSLQTDVGFEQKILQQVASHGLRMNGWLKFIGVMSIIAGALNVLTIFGIIFAWIPIWLGVLLLQAAGKAQQAYYQKEYGELVGMMDKLRLFFMIVGIYIIVMVALVILMIFFFSSIFMGALHNFQNNVY